jgi:hypothetical protein
VTALGNQPEVGLGRSIISRIIISDEIKGPKRENKVELRATRGFDFDDGGGGGNSTGG